MSEGFVHAGPTRVNKLETTKCSPRRPPQTDFKQSPSVHLLLPPPPSPHPLPLPQVLRSVTGAIGHLLHSHNRRGPGGPRVPDPVITESRFLPFSSVRCETSRYHMQGRTRHEGAPMMTYLSQHHVILTR
jgi:hypothetical protein